jgi:AraC-like DNA-binding protein
MPKLWSTADVHPRDRVAFWVDAVCDTFVRLDCEPGRGRAFFGEIAADMAGELQIGTVTSTAQVVTRSPRQIDRAPADFFLINVQRSGRSLVRQDGRETELRAGDFALYDSTRPYELAFDGDFSQIVLQMPRALLQNRLGAPERFTALRIEGSTNVGSLLSPLLRELPSRLSAIPAAARQRTAHNVLDLIATALLAEDSKAPIPAGMTLVHVKLWIETHLSEPLSAERIAASCGLSVRHLNRLFARTGNSLMQYVWERRLARCRRDLIDPVMRHRSIGEIALAAGFNDLSHFSRVYRARYHCTPREERAAIRIGQGPAIGA